MQSCFASFLFDTYLTRVLDLKYLNLDIKNSSLVFLTPICMPIKKIIFLFLIVFLLYITLSLSSSIGGLFVDNILKNCNATSYWTSNTGYQSKTLIIKFRIYLLHEFFSKWVTISWNLHNVWIYILENMPYHFFNNLDLNLVLKGMGPCCKSHTIMNCLTMSIALCEWLFNP